MNLKWLVWKDYRVNRLIFVTALVLLVAPHAMVTVGLLLNEWECRRASALSIVGIVDLPKPSEDFVQSSVYGVAILQLTFALLGGNLIAGERIDRSAEFLAYMPVSRGRHLASKLLVALASVPMVWLPNLAILAIAGAFVPPQLLSEIWRGLGIVAVTGLTFFCVAWFFSSMLESPTFSVCAGLIVPLLVAIGIALTEELLKIPFKDREFEVWYIGLCLPISAVTFPIGTLYYLRRVEP